MDTIYRPQTATQNMIKIFKVVNKGIFYGIIIYLLWFFLIN